MGRLGAEGATRVVALALPKGCHDTWLQWMCKGHRTKLRQEAPRVKVAWPYEDTLEACTTRGVTVMPL
jgi:hypothetical protein